MKDIDATDFFRDDGLVADPYPYFDALRAQCPVRRERHHDVVMVTGYDEALEVYNDPDTFSSCLSVSGPFPGFPVPLEGDDVSDLIEQHRDALPMSDQLPTLDPPTHTAHRGLLMRLITPKRLKENEASMWVLADRVLDSFLVGGEGEYVKGFAGPFTMLVIADLLGVPEEDRDDFARVLHQAPGAGGGVGSTGDESLGHSPLEYLYQRFSGYVEDRRREPRRDVLTRLAAATYPDGTVPEVTAVVRTATFLFAAGQETTARLLAAALKHLAEHPDVQDELRADRDRIPTFIDEALRIESPVKADFRLARRTTTIAGVDVKAGTPVMLLNGAANRDPERFECPAEFRVDRPNASAHIAFGRGAHSCPGGPLARAEARVSLERIFDRMGDIRLSEEHHGPPGDRRFAYEPTWILRGLTRPHLEFTPLGGAR